MAFDESTADDRRPILTQYGGYPRLTIIEIHA